LHDFNIVYCHLKPKNILLDALGHITICDFGLYKLEITNNDRETLEYPAPELLLGQDPTQMVDWWTLGVFLYEMLIGLPPFYDEDTNEIQRKILSEPLYCPGPHIVPPTAKDILTKLLNRKPEQRLGAKGAFEIKSHPFFHGIDWHKLLQRKYEPTFKPNNVAETFDEDPGWTLSKIRKEISGWSCDRPVCNVESKSEDNPSVEDSNLVKNHSGSNALPGKDAIAEGLTSPDDDNPPLSSSHQAAMEKDDGWVLIWEEAAQAFHFYNRFTSAIQSANPRVLDPAAVGVEPAPTMPNPPSTQPVGGGDSAPHDDDLTVHALPSQSQMQDALEVALEAEYKHVVPRLLEYGMDLNIKLFGDSQTPLEWATEHENLGLVKLFLDKGADANFTCVGFTGRPVLITAVEKANQGLVKVLVQRTDRVLSTRALCLAVIQQDITIVNIMLAYGVSCDFAEGDRSTSLYRL
jgi:serum/glucocorticoid-regulated kinase 2